MSRESRGVRRSSLLILVWALVAASCANRGGSSDPVGPPPSTPGSTVVTAVITLAPQPDSPLHLPREVLDLFAAHAPVLWATEEHFDLVVQCMNEMGWAHSITPERVDGVNTILLNAPEQTEAAGEALHLCNLEPVDLGYVVMPTASDDDVAVLYRAWTEVTVPCMQENGFPTDPPPSAESFIEAGGSNWHPHQAVPGFNEFGPPASGMSPEMIEKMEIVDRMRELCPSDLSVLEPQLSDP